MNKFEEVKVTVSQESDINSISQRCLIAAQDVIEGKDFFAHSHITDIQAILEDESQANQLSPELRSRLETTLAELPEAELKNTVKNIEALLASGGRLVAAQWCESLKASIEEYIDSGQLSESAITLYVNKYKELAQVIYYDESKKQVGSVDDAKRAFFTDEVGKVLDECDEFMTVGDLEDQVKLREITRQLDGFQVEYILKNLLHESADRLAMTLRAIPRSL